MHFTQYGSTIGESTKLSLRERAPRLSDDINLARGRHDVGW